MGTFTHPITLIGPSGSEMETIEALVDTGATFTSIPSPILERIGVIPVRRVRLGLANGEVVEGDMGEVVAQLNGERSTIWCIFSPPDAPPLIGAHTLEAFLLTVDPVEQRLVPKDALWLKQSCPNSN